MEYLMTYGWAILIIAVVLGALYSLHVFSSASLLPQACIATAGYECSNPVLSGLSGTLTLSLGQFTADDWSSGSSLCLVPTGYTYNGVCSGSGFVSEPIGALPSGGTASASFAGTIPANSPLGTPYAGIIWANAIVSGVPEHIQVATISVISTVSSASPSSPPVIPTPPGIEYYTQLTLSSSWSSVSSSQVQQMVTLSESSPIYGTLIAYSPNLANFEYFYGNDTIIPSWIESNSSGSLVTWLKIANTVAVNDIYLGFASKTANLLSSSGTSGIGEAPQLTNTYGQYDDGANIFNNYWNFAGTTLPTGWTNSGITYAVNNGITATATAPNGYISYGTSASAPIILEGYGNLYQPNTNWASIGLMTLPVTNQNGYQGFSISTGYFEPVGTYQGTQTEGSTDTHVGGNTASNANQIWGVDYISTSSSAYYTNYIQIGTTITTPTVSTPIYPAIFEAGASGATYTFSDTASLYWLRTRLYPPSGVMPSVSFSSVQ